MKQLLIIIFLFISTVAAVNQASAQTDEAEQLLLDLEKLTQLKSILKDLKNGYEIVSKGYTTIKNISQGNFNLHQDFLNSLLQVSPIVKNYKRVPDIISFQLQIVKEYKAAFNRFKQNGNFSLGEIDYISKVYSKLFNQSLKNLDALATVITANKLRMSDDERLTAIDGIYKTTQDQLSFLRYFTNSTSVLALQRTKEKSDVGTMNSLYGVNN